MKRIIRYMALAVMAMAAVTGCTESGCPECERDMSEVTLSLNVSLPTKAIGDPGSGHTETEAAWEHMLVYFVYDDGNVYPCHLTRSEYDNDGDKRFTFTVFEGTGTVYAVAFKGDAADYMKIGSAADVRGLQTGSLDAYGTLEEKKQYMLSLLSGKSGQFTFDADATAGNSTDVTLTRVAAKVDVHYDLQEAYENGGYVSATMGHISFYGLTAGYFFPEENAEPLAGMEQNQTVTATLDGAVSERSGRTYFYALPGIRNKVEFAVTYEQGTGALSGERTYRATFVEPVEAASWHYMRFHVSGTDGNVTGSGLTVERDPQPQP